MIAQFIDISQPESPFAAMPHQHRQHLIIIIIYCCHILCVKSRRPLSLPRNDDGLRRLIAATVHYNLFEMMAFTRKHTNNIPSIENTHMRSWPIEPVHSQPQFIYA